MIKILGKIAERLKKKELAIRYYEKLYSKVSTVQMYILRPFDKIWEKNHRLHIMSIEETILYIIENKCSIARYGDGEFNMVSGNGIGFQEKSDLLTSKLRNLLKNPSEVGGCLVALPGVFRDENEYEPTTRKFWNKILVKKRRTWYGLCNQNYVYGNADITRCYIELNDRTNSLKYFQLLKKVWADRKVIIIEGEKSRLGIGNDLFDNCKCISRILCPPRDAFKVYEKIIEYVRQEVEKDCLLLIALGPTATLMAKELSDDGYQAIDIGNIDKEYEWCISNSTHKTINPLKFTMEIPGGTDVLDCDDKEYLGSIIQHIN